MPPKKVTEPEKKPLIGRVGTTLRIGIVGVPNVGKSTFFNVLTKSAVAAENFPFCTIDPNENNAIYEGYHQNTICDQNCHRIIPIMTYNFVPENDELFSFKCNQHVLVQKEFIKYIRGFKNRADEKYVPPFLYKNYMKVNSYYEFAEDYDAVNRLPHVLFEQQEMNPDQDEDDDDLEEYLFNMEDEVNNKAPPKPKRPEKVDFFVDRLAQIQYLQTKPKCFVILGKPGLGEERLGRLLADYWRCVFINPETLIDEEIRSESRAGLCIEFNLRCGRAIGVDVIIRLLEQRLESEIVKHRGFVLCGFPLIANDLLADDPISSESAIFTAREIFEDLLSSAVLNDSIRHVSLTSLVSEEEKVYLEDQKRVSAKEGDALDYKQQPAVCYKSTDYVDDFNQMEFIMSLCEKHDYIIVYLKCANEEVVNVRQDTRYEHETLQEMSIQRERLENVSYSIYNESDEFLFGRTPEMGKRLLRVPRNFPSHVNVQLKSYIIDTEIAIEKYILLKHPEDVIRLDGRMAPNRLFRVLRLRLKVLPYGPAIIPQLLNSPQEEGVVQGEDRGPSPVPVTIPSGEQATEDTYLALRNARVLSPLYTWNLSIWNYHCPVVMKEGAKETGLVDFPVQFMNSIFFLSNEERCKMFLDNPRPFLLPPMPLDVRRIFIIGPYACDRPEIAQILKHFIGAQLIEFSKIKIKCLKSLKSHQLDAFRREALKIMKEKRKNQCLNNERKRLAKVRMYLVCILKSIRELLRVLTILSKYEEAAEKPQEIIDAEAILEKMSNFKELFRISTAADCQSYLDNEDLILPFLPVELQPPLVFTYEVIGPASECVNREYKKLLRKKMTDVSTDVGQLGKCLNTVLSENNALIRQGTVSGWIVNGLPPESELLQLIYPENHPDYTYCLGDSTGGEGLLQDPSFNMENLQNLLHEPIEIVPNVESIQFSLEDLVEIDLEEKRANVKKYLANNLPLIEDILQKMECPHEVMDLGSKSYKDILKDLIDVFERKYDRVPKEVTAEEKLQEKSNYGDFADIESGEYSGEGTEGEHDMDVENFNTMRRLGNTSNYDPVAYSKGILWKGKEDFLVNYFNKMWLFATADNMNEFIESPHRYDRHITVNNKLPPLRICLVGNKGVGRTTQAQRLSKYLGLFLLNFEPELLRLAGNDGDQAHRNDELDDTVLEEIILPFWREPNKREVGFVINNFPRTPKDIEFMIAHDAIPECIIELDMEAAALKRRLIDSLLVEWKNQIATAKHNEQKNLEEQLELWQAARDREKAILLNERRDRHTTHRHAVEDNDFDSGEESLKSYMSYEDAQREMEVEAILQEQMPPPVIIDNWETEDQARERLRTAVDEQFQELPSSEIRAIALEEGIPWYVVNADMDEIRVYNSIMQYLMPFINRNESFFERAYDISIEMAERLLELGYYFLSRFGKTCPVQMYENHNPLQMSVSMEAQFQLFPVIYSNYIYYLSGSENSAKFKKNILKYIQQDYISLPLLRARIAVTGPPRSGKTTVAERLCREYSLEHISFGKAIRRALKYMPSSILAKQVRTHLKNGEDVPLDLTIKCVEAMTFEDKAVALGFVLDGLPNSIEEVKKLAQMNLVPHLVIDLCVDLDYVYTHMDLLGSTHRPEYSKKFIEYRWNSWLGQEQSFRKWLDAEYQNFATVPISPSKWKTWGRANELVLSVINEIKHYYRHCERDMPLRIANMLITPYEFVTRRSQFRNYCPLCLYYENELTCGGMPPDRTGLLCYHDKYYYLCEDHILEFEDDPDNFLGPNIRHALPLELPIPLNLTEVPENVFLKGFCVVCLQECGGIEGTYNMGSLENGSLEYGGQVYMFDKPSCFTRFSKQPQLAAGVPTDISDNAPAFDINSLPTMGMLEQYVAAQLVKALIEVEALRPLVPGLTIAQSAVVCLGLILKINNPKTPGKHVEIYRKVKKDAIETQLEFRKAMKDAMHTLNPYIHYQEPLPPFKTKSKMAKEELVGDDSTYIHELIESMLDRIEYDEKKVAATTFELTFEGNTSQSIIII